MRMQLLWSAGIEGVALLVDVYVSLYIMQENSVKAQMVMVTAHLLRLVEYSPLHVVLHWKSMTDLFQRTAALLLD